MIELNYKNRKWMEFFNDNRNLWSPVASEWKRLSKIFIQKETEQGILAEEAGTALWAAEHPDLVD